MSGNLRKNDKTNNIKTTDRIEKHENDKKMTKAGQNKPIKMVISV